MKTEDNIFSPRLLTALFGIGIATFVIALVLLLFGSGTPTTTDPSAYSRSAIGHMGLAETLRRLDIPVVVSRFDSLSKAGPDDLLIVAEPDLDSKTIDLVRKLKSAPNVLLVLPKWRGKAKLAKPSWIGDMDLKEERSLEPLLDVIGSNVVLRRFGQGQSNIRTDEFGGKISVDTLQVVSSTEIRAVIDSPQGTLLGELRRGTTSVWVLSDPDIMANHGIDEGDNAAVIVNIISTINPKGGAVIFDEVIHGFEQTPNLLYRAIERPYVVVSFATLVAFLVLIWAGIHRFGAPKPAVPPLAFGQASLIRNSAELLRMGGSPHLMLLNYLRMVEADVLQELHGPRGAHPDEQTTWLDRLAALRGLNTQLAPLRMAIERSPNIDARRAQRLALELHEWKQEMLNGSGARSIDR